MQKENLKIVVKELKERGFKINEDLDKSMKKTYKKLINNYAVKITALDENRVYLLTVSIFEDGYRFSIMDKGGVIRLVSLKDTTPLEVITEYIDKCYNFFRI